MLIVKIENKEYKIEFSDNNFDKGIINNSGFETDISEIDKNTFHIIHKNISYNVKIISTDITEKKVQLKINNKIFETEITEEIDLLLKKMGIKQQSVKIKKELKAPMPGLILNIPVSKGQTVNKGDILLVLEAMKMENNLKAEHEATIKDILAVKGNSVEKNEVLIVFE